MYTQPKSSSRSQQSVKMLQAPLVAEVVVQYWKNWKSQLMVKHDTALCQKIFIILLAVKARVPSSRMFQTPGVVDTLRRHSLLVKAARRCLIAIECLQLLRTSSQDRYQEVVKSPPIKSPGDPSIMMIVPMKALPRRLAPRLSK